MRQILLGVPSQGLPKGIQTLLAIRQLVVFRARNSLELANTIADPDRGELNMRPLLRAGVLISLTASLLACEDADPFPTTEMEALAGHYYLTGVTDVGSELLLRKDGQFRWMLVYGASDQSAQGKWQLAGTQLVLKSVKPSSFKTMTFKVAKDGLAVDDADAGFRGTYVKKP